MTQHHRRIVAAAALFTASALTAALAGCAGPAPVTELDTDADVTIEVWSGQVDAVQETLQALADEYHEAHPNVTVKLSSGAPTADLLLQKLLSGFAANQYPDVSYAYGRWASELHDSGRTLDIAEAVEDPAVGWDDFPAAARQTVQPSGEEIIGFPAVIDNIGLIYNKTIFDQAGLDYPTDDWTWDDFREAARELTDPATQVFGYGTTVSGTGSTAFQFWPRLWQNGGQILDDDSKGAAFNSAAGVEALADLQAMAIDDKSIYLDQTETQYLQLFASDRIAMVTSGPWNLTDFKAAGTDYGVVQLPGTDGDHQTVGGPDMWALLDHDDVNRAYWATDFTNWLTQPEQDARFNVENGNLPLRTSELDTDAVKEQSAVYPGYDVFVENLGNIENALPTADGFADVATAAGKAISEVLQGQGDPQSALDDAVQESNAALAK
ncbi:ABC transporter substrate-binding protein [Herbiconiux sp. KACC 21604]|uniref:ABC transporter substrate-binding protein n=1 Tax=unclassified Herbiconiux TaxID=2618217 RepID=UPI0014922F61|nr:ABC transporter substrate-binding protein [Herbiconiux sp. SALV-R1]QJU54758.1 ABC transporter substrate-binding protein [Herbiconiux sp. SALV-R1]WPO85866.1 ABC transporter substrate-binding protein [Herbiconiux sp. KACC 21604]